LTPLKGKGEENPIKIKKLGLSVIGLRFVGVLTNDSIIVNHGGISVRIPSPESFCLRKLLIAQKRRKEDKKLKDAEQAILSSTIADRSKLRRTYLTLPKSWRAMIPSSLRGVKDLFPLLRKEIEGLDETLSKPD
jgi:hypothetical protein